jgi:putative endonuclease
MDFKSPVSKRGPSISSISAGERSFDRIYKIEGISDPYRKISPEDPMDIDDAVKSRDGRLSFGKRGERLAVDYLKGQGYRIVATNFLAPIGYGVSGRRITGEIDIIAYDESDAPFILSFLEVKTRSAVTVASPESAVDLRKQRQLIRTARVYRRLMNVMEEPYRYDVVSIFSPSSDQAEIKVFRGFFSETRFARVDFWDDRM